MRQAQRVQLRSQNAVFRGQFFVLGLTAQILLLLDGLGLPQGLGPLVFGAAQVVSGPGLKKIRRI